MEAEAPEVTPVADEISQFTAFDPPQPMAWGGFTPASPLVRRAPALSASRREPSARKKIIFINFSPSPRIDTIFYM